MNEIKIGALIIDIGALPARLAIVIKTDEYGFVAKHLKEFLSSEDKYPFHRFFKSDNGEYLILGYFEENNDFVQRAIESYDRRLECAR